MERDDGIQARYDEVYHFNSHAHVERDLYADKLSSYWQISTHTLTWSVTYKKYSTGSAKKISTHTLTWSVTASEDYCKGRHCISTHTLTWSVTNSVIAFRTITLISTHTLTWSVTLNHG